jgi:hypothetical protein
MPQIEVESYFMHQVFEDTEDTGGKVELPGVGVNVTFVDRSGHQRKGALRLCLDMYDHLVLECSEGHLVLRPEVVNCVWLDME